MDFELEELTRENYPLVRNIDREDVPENFVNTVDTIMRLTDYGVEHGLPGHTFAVKLDGEYADIHYYTSKMPFDRIRRITGYLVGTLDRFNNAKRSEEKDRVKHPA